MATIKNTSGRFQINALEYEEINVLIAALGEYKEFLESLLEDSTPSRNYYLYWSICIVVWMDFNKKVSNHLAMPKTFGKTMYLHELIVLVDALEVYKPVNDYLNNIALQLIFLLDPETPKFNNLELNK